MEEEQAAWDAESLRTVGGPCFSIPPHDQASCRTGSLSRLRHYVFQGSWTFCGTCGRRNNNGRVPATFA
eukprot:12400382-Karenia_brevis.AAC.1